MSEKPLAERYREHDAGAHRVKLTAAEQDLLKCRSDNHSADKEIMAIRAELNGINISIAILKDARDSRMARIKELQEGKRKAARGGA